MGLYKFGTSISFTILSISILYTHVTASLFPGITVGVFLSTGVLIGTALLGSKSHRFSLVWYLLPLVAVAVVYRLYVFIFPPSLVGIDPNGYALEISRVIRTGTIDAISYNFYSKAPLSISYPAMLGIGTGTSTPNTMMLYPLIHGVLLPLVAASLVSRVASRHTASTAVVACGLGALTTMSVHFGYVPIAQSLGVAYWTVFLLFMTKFQEFKSKRTMFLAVVVLAGLVFTHKLPLIVVFGAFLAFTLLTLLHSLVTYGSNNRSLRRYYGLQLGMLVGLLTLVQWFYITDFGKSVFLQSLDVLLTESVEISPPLVSRAPSHAVELDSSLMGILERRGHGFALLLVGGVTWLYQAYAGANRPEVRFLLAAALPPVIILLIAVVGNPPSGTTPPGPRLIGFLEPVIVPLFSITIGSALVERSTGSPDFSDKVSKPSLSFLKSALAATLILLLLFSQVASALAVPDYPDHPRDYLSSQEVQAKGFGNEHVGGPIHTDWFLMVSGGRNPGNGTGTATRYVAIGDPLLNATVTTQGYGHVMFRTDVEYYLTQIGPWKLLWEPSQNLDGEYNRIYANGGALLYDDPNTVVDRTPVNSSPAAGMVRI